MCTHYPSTCDCVVAGYIQNIAKSANDQRNDPNMKVFAGLTDFDKMVSEFTLKYYLEGIVFVGMFYECGELSSP